MKQQLILLVLSVALVSCSESQSSAPDSTLTTATSTNPKTETMEPTNKDKVTAFVTAVNANDAETARPLLHPDYIQHNPYLPTGRDQFLSLFPVLKENKTQAHTARMIQDGNFVVMHNLWTGAKPFGADEMVSFDVLRIDDDGQIAEHWDALQPNATETASGRSMTDGATEIVDRDKTEANKELVRNFMNDILYGKAPEKLTDYISTETYNQHNPQIKDGVSGLQEALQFLAANDDMFQYKKLHKVIGEGNFVLTINEGEWHGSGHVFYDLLRVENGKLVEHWDVIQPIPTENLANNNTMFNF